MKFCTAKRCASDIDEDMVYSPTKYRETEGIKVTTINRLTAPITQYPERFISADKLKAGNPDIDSNISNVEAFEAAGKEMFGEFGCLPMVAFGKTKVSSAFKLLARARDLDFETSNVISKQIQNYELDRKHAIENNQDDEDYDVDDEIRIEDYVDKKYMGLVNDSKQYQNIVINISPHPCAHLTYNSDLREDIGIIRLKAKTGNKEPKMCVYIDGARADALNYVKSDLLRVDVVKMISDGFKAAGKEIMPVNELLKTVKDDPKIWSLYWNGFTQCLNQCEKPASTQKCMQFKPKNVVELTAFIAGIRPGFKSMVSTFISRTPFKYEIKSLDKLLKIDGMTGASAGSSFLLFDEQILKILIAGGIPGAEAYATVKYIKKKKRDKVLAEKEKFRAGFTKYLEETEGATSDKAEEVVDKIWTIIENAASYMFCAAHAYAMACDSLYGAYLKAYYPYEFYSTILKLYTSKGNKEKISLIINEMDKYAGIKLTTGRFGQDSRDWYIDKENHTISQSLSSIKFMSPQVANDLHEAGHLSFISFADLLWYMLNNTCLDSRQIQILIGINYFEKFGKTEKLMNVYREFYEGPNKLKSRPKSWEKRLSAIREHEFSLANEDLPIIDRLQFEHDNAGLCISRDRTAANTYYVTAIDDKYKIIIETYNIARGTNSPPLRVKKQLFESNPIHVGDCIILGADSATNRQRFSYKDGVRTAVKGAYDWWLDSYRVIPRKTADDKKKRIAKAA